MAESTGEWKIVLKAHRAESFEDITCGNCGIVFYVPESWYLKRVSGEGGSRDFTCPNGHARYFIGETEAQRLKRELEAANKAKNEATAKMWQAQAAQQKAEEKNRKLTKRASAGVCPCCNRTVSQMARHMKTKHPDWKTQ